MGVLQLCYYSILEPRSYMSHGLQNLNCGNIMSNYSYKFDTYLHLPIKKDINQNVTHIIFKIQFEES